MIKEEDEGSLELSSKGRRHHFQIKYEEVSNDESKRVFWDFSKLPDLTLLVEGKELHVHKSILIQSSQVFKVMLKSESFVEKGKDLIELPDKKYDDVQEMLNYLYPFWHKITENTNVENLLNLSREYDIQSIKNMCEKYLLEKEMTIDLLVLAQENKLTLLREKCLNNLAKKKLDELKSHRKFDEITLGNINEISNRRVKALEHFCKLFLESSDELIRDAVFEDHSSFPCSCTKCLHTSLILKESKSLSMDIERDGPIFPFHPVIYD